MHVTYLSLRKVACHLDGQTGVLEDGGDEDHVDPGLLGEVSPQLAGAVQHLHHQLVVPVVPRQLVHGGGPLELDQTSSRHRSHGATVHIGTVVWRRREMVKQW